MTKDERNRQWKLAVSAIGRSGCSSQLVWDEMRKWYDSIAGFQQVVKAEMIVGRYMNVAKTMAISYLPEEMK